MDGFGERLKEIRKSKGYNQKQFAELLEITPTRLNYWENDKREPDFFMFSKIVEILNADANQLLGLNVNSSTDKNEKQLIEDYRKLSPQGQEYILQTMNMAVNTYKKDNSATDSKKSVG